VAAPFYEPRVYPSSFSLDILIFPPTSIPLSGYASKPSRPYRHCAIWVPSGLLSQHVHCASWINNSVLELCFPPLFIITKRPDSQNCPQQHDAFNVRVCWRNLACLSSHYWPIVLSLDTFSVYILLQRWLWLTYFFPPLNLPNGMRHGVQLLMMKAW
jgi:hypothetical protein